LIHHGDNVFLHGLGTSSEDYEANSAEIGNCRLNKGGSAEIEAVNVSLAHDLLNSPHSPTMDTITYRAYSGEHELPHIISLVQSELSEPYVVYTYRYFLHQWSVPLSLNPTLTRSLTPPPPTRPHLSFLVRMNVWRVG
jgi:hypothetical protein